MQKKKIAGYMRAKKAMETDPNLTVREAAKVGGLSPMTFYKYKKLFGDMVGEEQIEVLPNGKEPSKRAPKVTEESAIDRILRENAALAEQLKLREELSKYGAH